MLKYISCCYKQAAFCLANYCNLNDRGEYLFNEVLCILESPFSQYCVGYLLGRSVAKAKYFLFCGDMMMTSLLSPDCPKKMEKMEPMTSTVHREMFTCLGNLNFVTKCSTVL